jgi:hypothetical protein
MMAITTTGLKTKTGPPRDDEWVGYAWMGLFAMLLTLGFQALIHIGAL